MRILAVNIPEEKMHNGLMEVNMKDLGNFVVIAGKNGAGKSRLLNQISSKYIEFENYASGKWHGEPTSYFRFRFQDNEEGHLSQIINLKFSTYQLSVPQDATQKYRRSVIHNMVAGINSDQLKDALYLINEVFERYMYASHQNTVIDEKARKDAIDNFNRLNKIIKQLLHTEIGINKEFNPSLFDLNINDCNLSDGQSALIQIVALLYTQEINLENVILFFDEPETHLHPQALNFIIDRLDNCISSGQIWIATHSVPLLAHIASKNPSAIWYMDNGKIEYGGRIPEKVLESLIGDEKGIEELQDFCSLPAQFATNQFALESLLDAQTVGAKVGDKQTSQIVDSLRQAVKDKGRTIRVLDFGAGKGRLADALYYWARSEGIDNLSELIDYIAYDIFDDDKNICMTAISRIYESADGRYFNDRQQLRIKIDNSSVDFIIACNVFHEIPVSEWRCFLSTTGLFYKLLSEEGNLLWIEDRLMPRGEKAHRNGFIVFGPLEIKELFGIESDKLVFFYKDEEQKRLMKCIVSKPQFTGFSVDNLKRALKSLINESEEKVKQLRGEPFDFKKGKEHGFWSQQYINGILSLSELGG